MPKIDYTVVPFMIDLPDLIMQDITVKRRAQVLSQEWNEESASVNISYNIIPYENNGGSYGNPLNTDPKVPFAVKRIQLSANNGYYVDANTGEILCPVTEEYQTVDGEQVLNPALAGKDYMADYYYYNNMAHTKAVILADWIQQVILDTF